MKVTVLGNSNCLLSDGFLVTYRRARPQDTILNLSIGGSGSPVFLYQLAAHLEAVAGSDWIIVEPAVIDHGEAWQNPDRIAGFANVLLAQLRATGIPVLLLMLPRNATYLEQTSPGMLAWAAAAQSHNVPILDTRADLLAYARRFEIDPALMWRDGTSHPTADLQRLVGQNLVIFADRLSAPAPAAMQAPGRYRAITGQTLSDSAGLEAITRSNSLMTVHGLPMTAGQRLDLSLDADECVMGFMINYGELDGSYEIKMVLSRSEIGADQTVNLQNRFLQAKPDRPLMAMFASCPGRPGLGQVLFPLTEGHARFHPDTGRKLEILGILVGTAPPPLPDWRATGSKALGVPAVSD
jgi:hypothetical protein